MKSERQKDAGPFRPEQKRFLASQVMASVYNSLVSGVLMTGFLLYLGVAPSKVGVVLSIPLLANIFQLMLERIWSRLPDSGRTINRLVFTGRMLILSIILIPLLLPGQDVLIAGSLSARTAMAGVILAFAYTIAASSGIRLNYWMVNMVDADIQGTFFARRDRIVVVITTVLSFLGGILIDELKANEREYIGFAAVFLAAAVIAAADYAIIRKIPYVEMHPVQEKQSFLKYVGCLRSDRRFGMFLFYMFWLNFATNMANPYYNAYMLDQLHLSFTHVMLLTSLQVLTQMLVAPIWGRIANRIHWNRILLVTTAALGVQFFIWPLVTSQSMGLILVIFFTSGLIATGLVTSQFMIPYDYIKPERAMAYLGLATAVTACGGFIGSFTGSRLISWMEQVTLVIGRMVFGSMQINMIISGILILGSVCYARRMLKWK